MSNNFSFFRTNLRLCPNFDLVTLDQIAMGTAGTGIVMISAVTSLDTICISWGNQPENQLTAIVPNPNQHSVVVSQSKSAFSCTWADQSKSAFSCTWADEGLKARFLGPGPIVSDGPLPATTDSKHLGIDQTPLLLGWTCSILFSS